MNHHHITVSFHLLSIAALVAGCSSEPTPEHRHGTSPPSKSESVEAPAPVFVEAETEAVPDEPVLTAAHRPTIPASELLGPEVRPTSSEAGPPPSDPAVGEDAGLRVKRLLLSREVREREPVDPATTFAASEGRLYAFVELVNASPEPRTVVIRFAHERGFASGDVTLEVPALVSRWRTWAWSAYVRQPGSWRAIVTSDGGVEIGRLAFEVE